MAHHFTLCRRSLPTFAGVDIRQVHRDGAERNGVAGADIEVSICHFAQPPPWRAATRSNADGAGSKTRRTPARRCLRLSSGLELAGNNGPRYRSPPAAQAANPAFEQLPPLGSEVGFPCRPLYPAADICRCSSTSLRSLRPSRFVSARGSFARSSVKRYYNRWDDRCPCGRPATF